MKPEASTARMAPLLAAFTLVACVALCHAADDAAKPPPAFRAAPRLASEDFQRAQNMIQRDRRWKNWINEKRRWLQSWMDQRTDQASWVAGVQHDLLDSKTQHPQRWTPELAQPTSGESRNLEAWVAWRRAYNINRVMDAAYLWRLTGDSAARDWAAAQIDFYADNYSHWPLRTRLGPARMMGQTLDESTALVTLCRAIRLLGPSVATARLNHWLKGLVRPTLSTIASARFGGMNIAIWNGVAQAVAALQLKDDLAFEQVLNGPEGLLAILTRGVNADGLWYEGSFGYHSYVLAALGKLFEAASAHGREAAVRPLKLIAARMIVAPVALGFDDGLLPAVGDDRPGLKAVDPQIHYELHRHIPTPWGLAEAAKRLDWEPLIDPVDSAVGSKDLPLPARAMNLEASRMAVLRRGPWQLFVRYGQSSGEHWHVDALGYDLAYGALRITSDPGTVEYGAPLHSRYFQRAAAHNVPVIDGRGPDHWQAGKVDRFDANLGEFQVSHQPYAGAALVQRSYRLDEEGYRETTALTAAPAATPRRLGQLLHLNCSVDLANSALQVLAAADSSQGDGFEWWTEVRAYSAPAKWGADLKCGEQHFRMQVQAASAHQVVVASEPTTPLPRRRTVVYLETVGQTARYVIEVRR